MYVRPGKRYILETMRPASRPRNTSGSHSNRPTHTPRQFLMSPLRHSHLNRRCTALVMLTVIALACVDFLSNISAPASTAQCQEPSTLVIRPGDRICLIGNTLADRMQHFGWLETFLQ